MALTPEVPDEDGQLLAEMQQDTVKLTRASAMLFKIAGVLTTASATTVEAVSTSRGTETLASNICYGLSVVVGLGMVGVGAYLSDRAAELRTQYATQPLEARISELESRLVALDAAKELE
ncbi:MAG: hypothetical protein JWN38_394 [Candidatus Saccharibacteria bacterium]|nr:hypothetical protein [Candidatus Saccharibacteria bacterium]